MKILVTGAAGFIGSALAIFLLKRGDEVVGIDNHNDYYSQELKEDRVKRNYLYPSYSHFRINLNNKVDLEKLFNEFEFDAVVNLAAQAGVRYSLENPMAYVDSNIIGFINILEACKNNKISHLVYASSSSVYGSNSKMPFSIHDSVDHPLSIYAATKKANELMAHTYSHLYDLPTTGLRFFTVYGPWDRPDMALQKFATAIKKGKKIKVFNHGNHCRDFTYIDDIVEGISKVLDKPPLKDSNWSKDKNGIGSSAAPWRLYNIGSNSPVKLLDYIEAIENALGVEAKKEFLPMQPGDVPDTFADVDDLIRDFNYKPSMPLSEGIKNFATWFKDYYKV
jgi:UDP-glucuronate 4-epimerase